MPKQEDINNSNAIMEHVDFPTTYKSFMADHAEAQAIIMHPRLSLENAQNYLNKAKQMSNTFLRLIDLSKKEKKETSLDSKVDINEVQMAILTILKMIPLSFQCYYDKEEKKEALIYSCMEILNNLERLFSYYTKLSSKGEDGTSELHSSQIKFITEDLNIIFTNISNTLYNSKRFQDNSIKYIEIINGLGRSIKNAKEEYSLATNNSCK